VTTNGAIQERRPGPAFVPLPPASPLIPTAVSAGLHSPAIRNQQPLVAAGRSAQPAVNFILGHLHDRRPAVLVPSGGSGGLFIQTGRDKTMTAPLPMTSPLPMTDRRRAQAGSSLVQVGRTTPVESARDEQRQQLTSLSEDEKLTAIFVSTLGGTVAASPAPGADEGGDWIDTGAEENTGKGKKRNVSFFADFTHSISPGTQCFYTEYKHTFQRRPKTFIV
jgi:hypothetical protein